MGLKEILFMLFLVAIAPFLVAILKGLLGKKH